MAVDVDGKVWTANAAASSLSRIDPFLGPIGADGQTPIGLVDLTVSLPGASPYNYSDMTGALALGNTSPQGTWQVIQDSGIDGASWGVITWNLEPQAQVPAGTELTVEARAADSEAGLGGEPFADIVNGVPFALTGRYIQGPGHPPLQRRRRQPGAVRPAHLARRSGPRWRSSHLGRQYGSLRERFGLSAGDPHRPPDGAF